MTLYYNSIHCGNFFDLTKLGHEHFFINYQGPRFLKSTEIHELNRRDKNQVNILIYKI